MLEKNKKLFIKTLEEINIIEEYKKQYFDSISLIKNISLDAIIFRLIQVSEYLDMVDEVFQNIHPEVPWRNIKGFRNRLVHDYGGVDLEFVENVLNDDIPILKEQLLRYIES